MFSRPNRMVSRWLIAVVCVAASGLTSCGEHHYYAQRTGTIGNDGSITLRKRGGSRGPTAVVRSGEGHGIGNSGLFGGQSSRKSPRPAGMSSLSRKSPGATSSVRRSRHEGIFGKSSSTFGGGSRKPQTLFGN